MARKRAPYALIYSPAVAGHLGAIGRRHYPLIRSTIEERLIHEPLTETRNRKPLKRPVSFEAEWELRFGPDNRFRVFYEVDPVRGEVRILAIGVKVGSRLFIGGEEIEL
jgi:hypothetical protein